MRVPSSIEEGAFLLAGLEAYSIGITLCGARVVRVLHFWRTVREVRGCRIASFKLPIEGLNSVTVRPIYRKSPLIQLPAL